MIKFKLWKKYLQTESFDHPAFIIYMLDNKEYIQNNKIGVTKGTNSTF